MHPCWHVKHPENGVRDDILALQHEHPWWGDLEGSAVMEPGAKAKRGVNTHEGQIVVHSLRAMSQGRGGCRQFKLNANAPTATFNRSRQEKEG
jgi:hypothetical protein